MSEKFERHEPSSASFPPRDLWRFDPIKEGKLDVVYDSYDLRLIDMNATLARLMTTVETENSGYQFASTYADLHHGAHDEADYPNLPDTEINPRKYRGLACNKMILNRVKHAWWHRVFNKPLTATTEGMRIMIEAQSPISQFYESVTYVNQKSHGHRGEFNHREFYSQLSARMGFYAAMLDRLQNVPLEFQIVRTDGLWVDDVDDVIRTARMFKKHARPKVPLPLVTLKQESEIENAA